MHQAFNTVAKLNKRAVIGDVCNPASNFCANLEIRLRGFPWVCLKLLHAKGNTLCFRVETDNLYFNSLTNLQGF